MLERAATANVLFANADEARALTDCDPERALEELAGRFELVCVKLGDGGALAAQRGEIIAEGRLEGARRPGRVRRRVRRRVAGRLLQDVLLGSALEDACAAGATAAAAAGGLLARELGRTLVDEGLHALAEVGDCWSSP